MMKPRHLIMVVGVVGAGWLALFGDKTPGGEVAEAVVTPRDKPAASNTKAEATTTPSDTHTSAAASNSGTDAAAHNSNGKAKHEPVILALRAREDLIGGAGTSNKENALFGTQSWVPPPPPPPKPAAPPPPTAPELPFTYIGKKLEDGVWEVYLTQGEHTIIAHDKGTIEQTYRIESIKPPTMTLTYLPLNQMQTLTIGGEE